MQSERKITNDDIWSAVRGLGMYRKSIADLEALIAHHGAVAERWQGGEPMFANLVITEAARQVIVSKRQMGEA